jgi:hypothetical protein
MNRRGVKGWPGGQAVVIAADRLEVCRLATIFGNARDFLATTASRLGRRVL